MIPPFSGRVGRRAYWSGLLFWTAVELAFSLVIISLVTLLHPVATGEEGNYINTLGALLFIMGFLYYLVRLASLIIRRGYDVGKYGLIYACLAFIFTPMLIIIGLLPSAPDDTDQKLD